jgi:hypothetical protein
LKVEIKLEKYIKRDKLKDNLYEDNKMHRLFSLCWITQWKALNGKRDCECQFLRLGLPC